MVLVVVLILVQFKNKLDKSTDKNKKTDASIDEKGV